MSKNSLEILQTLIRFKTDAVYEKHTGCLDYVEGLLTENGWYVARVSSEFQDHLVAVNRGELHDILDGVLLSGHLDVVPGRDDQFEPRIENGRLYGRGTVDMKFFAASVLAQLDFLKARPFPVVIVFTFDEELLGHGIEAVHDFLRDNRIQPAACLLGEPTDFNLCIGTRGVIDLTTRVTGKPAHSSMPDLGINAIYIMAKAAQFLENLNRELAEKGANLNVGQIRGGEKPNIVAASGEMIWNLRTFDTAVTNDALERFDVFCRGLEAEYPGAKIETKPDICQLPPFHETRDFLLLQRGLQLLGTKKITFPYATEAGYYQQLDIPTIICGVPDSRLAHTADEHIVLTDLEKYDTFLHDLLDVEAIA